MKETLLLKRSNVADLLTIDECITAVEQAFRQHGVGQVLPPGILGMHVQDGGFHVKAGVLGEKKPYFVAKINANFPENTKRNGLPTIQGIIVMCDGLDGTLLALIDSIEITIIRTGAATAVAAKYLACPGADTATICGCGNQGRISLKALIKTRPLKTVYVFDIEKIFAEKLCADFSRQVKVIPVQSDELPMALKQSGIVVTCTPSTKPFIRREDIVPGTFVAAVGADSENKQELFSDLLVGNKVVVDVVDQSAAIGELHHAIKEKKVSIAAVHAELGMIVAGKKPGRESCDEIIIFDSTGMALQDVAAASFVYEKAVEKSMGVKLSFAESPLVTGGYEKSINQRHLRALRSWFPFR